MLLKMVVLTSALSVLHTFGHSKMPTMSRILKNFSQDRVVCLQWIPAHCSIQGNEKADVLAKLGATRIQPLNPVSREEKTTAIKPSTHHHETAHITQQAQCAHERKVKADPISPVFLWHRATNCSVHSTKMSPTARRGEGCVSKTNTSTRQTIWKE
jgi:hypothetical protein